jgi:hypothetical protein
MTQPTVELRFNRGDAGAAEIRSAARAVLAELADPTSDAARAARTAGLDPADLDQAEIDVREGRQGAEPILTTIVVGIAVKVGASAAEALWRKAIWPSLRRRLGARVLGDRLPETPSETASATPSDG